MQTILLYKSQLLQQDNSIHWKINQDQQVKSRQTDRRHHQDAWEQLVDTTEQVKSNPQQQHHGGTTLFQWGIEKRIRHAVQCPVKCNTTAKKRY